MTTHIAIGSVRGGPGATTTSLLIGRCIDDALVVEADVYGGTVAATFGLGREPGLVTFGAREAAPDLWRSHAQSAGGVPVLVGPDSPANAAALWRSSGDRLERNLDASEVEVVIRDVGRVSATAPPLARIDLLLLLVRPMAADLVTLSHVLPPLRNGESRRVALVGVGDGAFDLDDTGLGVDALGHLPHDPSGVAALLEGRGRKAARTTIGRSIVGLADAAARAARVQQQFPVEAGR